MHADHFFEWHGLGLACANVDQALGALRPEMGANGCNIGSDGVTLRRAPPDDGFGEAIKLTGVSRNTLKQHFRALVERGTLDQHGSGRGVWYGLR